VSDDQIYVAGLPVGGTVTIPRTELFPHIGGPCDGTLMPVEVADDGTPVELNLVYDFTAPNEAIPAFAGHQSQLLTSTYEREEVLGDDGFSYQYVYRGTDQIDQNAKIRKAA
jgi:hypothetical protein